MAKEMTTATRAVGADMQESWEMQKSVISALSRFHKKDWGEISDTDKKANDIDQKNRDGRILGKYATPKGEIFITRIFDEPSVNADVVTVMYCEEY